MCSLGIDAYLLCIDIYVGKHAIALKHVCANLFPLQTYASE